MSNLLIGLTGTYCAGKNYVSHILEKRGLSVLDIDKLGHEVIESEKERILRRFGEDILSPDGRIDRKKLGKKVFGKPEELAALEGIIHPAANQQTLSWIKSQGSKSCVINAALLHRSIVFETLDAIIIVEAPLMVRFFRAKKRDRLPTLTLVKRFMSQRGFRAQYFRGKTDIYRVKNDSNRCKKIEFRIDEILSLLGVIGCENGTERTISTG